MTKHVEIDGEHLTLEQIYAVAYDYATVSIKKSVIKQIKKSRDLVERIVSKGEPVYGINTGFGSLKDKNIDKSKLAQLQINLIRSHACGVGPAFSEAEVRVATLIRANSLARGYSGVRVELIESLLNIINLKIYPYVPQQGSVGSSGDLAPLSHLALVLIGEGEVIKNGERIATKEVLKSKKIKPIKLEAKEGLALNNGTSFLTAVATLNIIQAEKIFSWALKALALDFEALGGTLAAFDERIHDLRNQEGQKYVAEVIRKLCKGSKIIGPGNGYSQIQDSYSLRCSAQVLGSVWDAIQYSKRIVENEINAVTDNPLIFEEGPISGGNFHGEPVSQAMDFLSIAMTQLGNIAERRIAKLIDTHHSNGLPAYLTGTKDAGLNSGFMIPQYVAASLVAENKVLAHSVVIDSIPTSANQEDYVSFGTTASRKCRDIILNTRNIVAIELLCSTQGVDFRGRDRLSRRNLDTYRLIRQHASFVDEDRTLYTDIEKISEIISYT